MKVENIKRLLETVNTCPSKWELDNIIWSDRLTDPEVLSNFLNRINGLNLNLEDLSSAEKLELVYLTELLEDMDESDCIELLNQSDEDARNTFIEKLARQGAIEVITNQKISFDTMSITCKLSPSDFILCAKRTQDLIDSISALAIKGETLSKDVAGA